MGHTTEGDEMNEEERDELLIRVDQRTNDCDNWIKDWIKSHEQLHKDNKSYLHKWLLGIVTTLIGLVAKMLFGE